MDIILYSYSEHSKKGLRIKEDNVLFFLEKGIINNENITYIFIINGDLKNEKIKNKLYDVNNSNNNFEIYFRENKGYDFGGYSDILLSKIENIKKYKYFFFINDSVRGPFIPFWNNYTNWTNYFKNLFNEEITMVGPTLNFYMGNPHINSEMFVLNNIGLELAIKNNIFTKHMRTDFADVINNCEIKLSKTMLDNNYNIKCLCERYKNIDFRICRGDKYKDSDLNANFSHRGDPLFTNKFYGGNINIYEVIFIKANRGIDDALLDRYYIWSN